MEKLVGSWVAALSFETERQKREQRGAADDKRSTHCNTRTRTTTENEQRTARAFQPQFGQKKGSGVWAQHPFHRGAGMWCPQPLRSQDTASIPVRPDKPRACPAPATAPVPMSSQREPHGPTRKLQAYFAMPASLNTLCRTPVLLFMHQLRRSCGHED